MALIIDWLCLLLQHVLLPEGPLQVGSQCPPFISPALACLWIIPLVFFLSSLWDTFLMREKAGIGDKV